MTDVVPWEIEIDELGRVTRCQVDGQTLAGIAAVEVTATPGQPPALTLYPYVAGTVSGVSIVGVAEPGSSRLAVLEWLGTLDAEMLEARALESLGGFGGPTSTGAAFLAALRAEAEVLP